MGIGLGANRAAGLSAISGHHRGRRAGGQRRRLPTPLRHGDALIKDFRALYPKVQVKYYDLNSTEVYNRYLSGPRNAETADVLWSGVDGTCSSSSSPTVTP